MKLQMKTKKIERAYTEVTDLRHLMRAFAARGDKIMFDYYDRREQVQRISFAAFVDRVEAFTAGLAALSLRGKRLAVIGETSPDWYVAYLSAICGGGTAIPLDRELAVAEIENFLVRSGAEAIVFSPTFENKFREMAAKHPEIAFLPMEAPAVSGAYGKAMEEIVALGKGKPSAFDTEADIHRMSVMLFTSGTTGTSKCVMLSEHNVCSAINAACAATDFHADDLLVSVLPVHHTYELCCSLAALNDGVEIAINDSLRHALRNFKRFRPTGLVLVPLFMNTMEKRIWEELHKKHLDKVFRRMMQATDALAGVGINLRKPLYSQIRVAFGGRLCKIICGGAPLNQDVADTFRAIGVRVWEGYGITECSPLVAVDPFDAPRPGSVGPAVKCCKVRIDGAIPDENGHEIGEICVKGDNVMLGYYDAPEATAEAFTEDGWFRTGDVGYLDADGYLYITGRQKSVIVLENGKNVFPEEIEEYLETVEQIAECVVVGRKAEDSDTVVLTAIVYPNLSAFPAGASKEEICATLKAEIAKVNKKLVGYKQIRHIELRDTEFEKTTTKKIRRNLVK